MLRFTRSSSFSSRSRAQFASHATGSASATPENGLPLCGCLLGTMRHHAGLPPDDITVWPDHPVMGPAVKLLETATSAERRKLGGRSGLFGLVAWSDYHADVNQPEKVVAALRRTAHSEIAKNLH